MGRRSCKLLPVEGIPPFIVIDEVFTGKQCGFLIQRFNEENGITEKFGSESGRDSMLTDIENKGKLTPVFNRLYTSICSANSTYKFRLYRYPEVISVIRYSESGHCGWHFDGYFHGDPYGYYPKRKLSCVVMLSEPGEDFTGGQLEFDEKLPANPHPVLKKGSAIFFPSFVFHRVLPVITGVRYTAVMFCEGPVLR